MTHHADCGEDWPTGFMLLQGNRLESLCGLMTTWMKRHPLHPLENEVVLVQSNGIGQWLKLALAANPRDALSGGCGIAAAVEVTLPARFIWRVYRSVLEVLPDSSAFDKAPMSWRLYRLLGDLDALLDVEIPMDFRRPPDRPRLFRPAAPVFGDGCGCPPALAAGRAARRSV